MAAITLSELEDYLARELSGRVLTAASAVVDMVQADLEAHLGRTVEIATHSVEGLQVWPNQDFINLPHTPVRSVSSLTIDGTAWPVNSWAVERSGLRLLSSASTFMASETSIADVVYVAGFGENHPIWRPFRHVVLRRSARLVNKIEDDVLGVDNVSVESYSAQFLDEWFTETELESVERWRRRVVSASPPPMAFSPLAERWQR